jgi:hypothetical protein
MVVLMITGTYFRNQATICLQLSRSTLDQRVAAKLIEMAEDFVAKADELDSNTNQYLSKSQQSPNGTTDRK